VVGSVTALIAPASPPAWSTVHPALPSHRLFLVREGPDGPPLQLYADVVARTDL